MGKYALLVGINYHKNPEAALKGCVNDTYLTKSILLSKGFDESDIKMINDEDDSVPDPSGAEVKKGLKWLCDGRSADDVVVFHYSGHGTQVPSDGDDAEADKKDEAIVLEGMFLLADDDIKQFFTALPEGCQATFISDCCHSGGMLDHKEVAISGDKADDEPQGDPEDSEARSLPVNTIAQILSSKLGKPVSPTSSGINGSMASIFGGDAGKLAMAFAASQMGGGSSAGGNPLAALLGGGGSGGAGAGGGMAAAAGIAGALLGGGSGDNKTSSPGLAGILGQLGLQGTESATSAGAPAYQPTEQPLSDDVGILITGCQSHQTSADVRPKNGKPHGALTNAIKTVYDQKPDATYSELVLGVRAYLAKSGFSQNPQLECSGKNADLPFICGGGSASAPAEIPDAPAPSTSAPSGDAAGAGGLMKLFAACFKQK